MGLTYVLSRRSEIQTATETSFTFDKVDSFVVSAYPANREYTGSASLVLRVDNRLVRLTGSDCSLSVSEIKGLNSASLPGVTVGVKKVAYENGERILSDTDSNFIVVGSGSVRVVAVAAIRLWASAGAECHSHHSRRQEKRNGLLFHLLSPSAEGKSALQLL